MLLYHSDVIYQESGAVSQIMALDPGGKVKNTTHSELEIGGCQA